MRGPRLPRELAVAAFAVAALEIPGNPTAFAASADLPPSPNGAAYPPGSTVAPARVSAREERAG